jgi:hypothetical protein
MPSGKLDADGLDHGERSPAQKTKNGLRAARKRRGMSDWGPWKDNKLMAVVDKYDDAAFASLLSYKSYVGHATHSCPIEYPHLFNQQTHHRDKAHRLSVHTNRAASPALDLLAFQQGGTAPDLEALITSSELSRKRPQS